ncbi:hypothetical protein DZC30_19595 [Comamonas testosteroni]|uniref:Uncharacterized protein n=1 Tax=Comamonas testosteroni TaxID=285 RepID=A0A373F9Y2_COMTE|nr:hypothetical protein [Comamonas testosteroni]RGE40954.1 hypothetical protein DZC30_19595 [Comamonas testosteroni]
MQTEATTRPPVALRNAKWSELGDVPLMEFVDLLKRFACVAAASILASIGSNSFAIGLSVFFGLWAVVSAIDKTKS